MSAKDQTSNESSGESEPVDVEKQLAGMRESIELGKAKIKACSQPNCEECQVTAGCVKSLEELMVHMTILHRIGQAWKNIGDSFEKLYANLYEDRNTS